MPAKYHSSVRKPGAFNLAEVNREIAALGRQAG
jgi:hypothetical protein